MSGKRLNRAIRAATILAVCATGLFTIQYASAQSVPPSAAPSAIDALHPTVSGILVAKPINGEGNIPAACRDRDQASVNAATLQKRGLVICTEEGRLVLLQLSTSTGIYARYWGKRHLRRFVDGDHINAWGVLTDRGYVLDPTYAVQDTDIQEAFADSQDFILRHGSRLVLDVLQSDPNSPVRGMVFAVRGGETDVTLCGGHPGRWEDLTAGKTINITRSLFNRRLETYEHTGAVQVVSCR